MGNDQQAEDLKQHARHEGARVGRLGLSSNLNPYRPDDPLYAEWLQFWQSAIAAACFSNVNARRAA